MPAARADEQHRGLVVQRIMPAGVGVVELDRPAHRIEQIGLALDHVVPGGRVGILEISHEHARPAIERVDHHLAVGRAGDLDAPIADVVGDRRHPPVAVADRLGFGQEIGFPSAVEALLDFGAAVEKAAALGAEFALEPGEKRDRLRGQHLVAAGWQFGGDRDPSRQVDIAAQLGGSGHGRCLQLSARAADDRR